MAAKDDVTEPSRRPVPLAQKLSGRLTRQRSTRSSVFKFKRHKKNPSPETTPEYKPLEVDLAEVEAFRLSEGWLETKERTPRHDQEKKQQQQPPPPPAPPSSTTPIADLFKSKSVFNHSEPEQLSRYSPHKFAGNGTRPVSMWEARPMPIGAPGDIASMLQVQRTGSSILDRGRPVEPRRPADPRFTPVDPPRKTNGLQHELIPDDASTVTEKTAIPDKAIQKPYVARYATGGVGVSATTKQLLAPRLEAPKKMDPVNRHSMYAVLPSLLDRVAARARAAQAPENASAKSPERIRDWQKSITSAPRFEANPETRSASPAPSQAPPPVRKVSARGGVGSRLAWIKELEEKKSTGVNRDIPALKRHSGGVKEKLAMFENKQAPAAASPALGPLPLTRTNSTTSRFSSVGLESTSSVYENATATPRTSVDTFRSTHRASSVMSYYDDSFREKMESVVSGYAIDEENDDMFGKKKQQQQRVTARFVPVKPEQAEESSSSQSDASTENVMNNTA